MSLTQKQYTDLIREQIGLGPGPVNWAMLKLTADALGIQEGPVHQPGELDLGPPQACILVGHTRGTGAVAFDGQEEWEWNNEVRYRVIDKLELLGVKAVTFDRTSLSYTKAVNEYADFVNNQPSIRATIELHFNSSDSEQAEGFEYIQDGRKGRDLATYLAREHKGSFNWQSARGGGVKPPYNGRGSGFLLRIKEAAVIAEPAFGSNVDEWTRFRDMKNEYASSLALGISNYLNETS